jgi:hypothetical protein
LPPARPTGGCTRPRCATLRGRLRSSDIWVAGSRDYRAFEDYLLPAEAARNIGIDHESDPTRYMKARGSALHERLNFVMARAGRGELDGVGALYIARMKPAAPEPARALAIRLNGMLPRVRIETLRSLGVEPEIVPAHHKLDSVNAVRGGLTLSAASVVWIA